MNAPLPLEGGRAVSRPRLPTSGHNSRGVDCRPAECRPSVQNWNPAANGESSSLSRTLRSCCRNRGRGVPNASVGRGRGRGVRGRGLSESGRGPGTHRVWPSWSVGGAHPLGSPRPLILSANGTASGRSNPPGDTTTLSAQLSRTGDYAATVAALLNAAP